MQTKNDIIENSVKEENSLRRDTGHQGSSSNVPLLLSEKVQRSKGCGVYVLVGVPHKDYVFKTHLMMLLNERNLKDTLFGNYKLRADLPFVVEIYMKKKLDVCTSNLKADDYIRLRASSPSSMRDSNHYTRRLHAKTRRDTRRRRGTTRRSCRHDKLSQVQRTQILVSFVSLFCQ